MTQTFEFLTKNCTGVCPAGTNPVMKCQAYHYRITAFKGRSGLVDCRILDWLRMQALAATRTITPGLKSPKACSDTTVMSLQDDKTLSVRGNWLKPIFLRNVGSDTTVVSLPTLRVKSSHPRCK